MTFFETRRLRKGARELLRHTKHLRRMREDILSAADLTRLTEAEAAVIVSLRSRDTESIEKACQALDTVAAGLAPAKSHAGWRENLEVIVVAVAVAMGVRTYFLQPFKIPTGSMQPTLYGIHSIAQAQPGFLDRVPLKYAKWLVTGDMYKEVRAKTSGYMAEYFQTSEDDPSILIAYIAGVPHNIPRDGFLKVKPTDFLRRGDLLWSGIVKAGDHVFVDKVSWNFRPPRRGEIVVFSTTGISQLPQGTHYIKRLVGLPSETLSVSPPNVVVNGHPVRDVPTIVRVADHQPPYDFVNGRKPNQGYECAAGGILDDPTKVIILSDGSTNRQYLAFGDNTGNSRDGRFWGPVPCENLLGPACMVYWPFTRRWGLTR